MPELPGIDQLGQRQFQDRSQVVRPSVDMSGQQNLVNTVQQVASNVSERVDQSNLQNAKIQFQKAKLAADSAFDQDTDFETYHTRYEGMLNKAAEDSSKLIRNPRLQEQFKNEISLYQAQGLDSIKKKAIMKETDHGLATLDDSLTTARENYLRATDPTDKQFARDSMSEAIDLAQTHAYIDADKAQVLRQKTAVDLAIASVNTEQPAQQVKLLKENKGLIDVIPKDVRLEMLNRAENKSQTDVALTLAGGIRAKGGTLDDRFKEADKIGDVKTRELVRGQVEEDYGREKRAKSESQYNAYDTLKKGVIAGKSSLEVSKENPDMWESMSGDQQQAIRSMDTRKDPQSDLNVYNNLNQLASKDKNQAYQYFLDNADKLSPGDVEKWSDRFAKPEELDGYLTRSQRLDSALSLVGVKDHKSNDYKLAQDQLDKDTIAFEKTKGRKPDADELTKLVNGVTNTVVEGGWGNPFSQGYLYVSPVHGFNATPEQRKDKQLNDKLDLFKTKLNKWESNLGVPVSDDEKNRLFKAWNNAGLLDAK